jgi:hypothetical protein
VSADNWAKCPRCWKKVETEKERVVGLYGKVGVKEFLEKVAGIKDEEPEEMNSLREDYELGIWEGKFQVSYSGNCRLCGFNFGFKHEEEVKG